MEHWWNNTDRENWHTWRKMCSIATLTTKNTICMGLRSNLGFCSKGTHTVQADSDSESRRRSPRRLPAGWDRRVEANYRHWLQTSGNNGIDKWRCCSSSYCFRKCSLKIEKREWSEVHDISQLRGQYGEYHHLFPQLKADGEWVFQYFRMDIETFTYILEKTEHRLIKNWCNLHQQKILPEEHFVITLR